MVEIDLDEHEPAPSGMPQSGRVQSLERAIALLQAIAETAEEGASIADLAGRCGINRATAWRLLATMERQFVVERDPLTNRYLIGFAIARMASSAGVDGLVRRAHGILRRVCEQTGETAALAVVRRIGLTYVDEVVPSAVISAKWQGRQVPLHATSTGKALLAWLPEAEVSSLLAGPLTGYTDTTITNRARLLDELAATRKRGYGTCVGELEASLFGVSAPVLDQHQRPFAVVSIWGPNDRVPQSRFEALGVLALEAADDVARSMADLTPRRS